MKVRLEAAGRCPVCSVGYYCPAWSFSLHVLQAGIDEGYSSILFCSIWDIMVFVDYLDDSAKHSPVRVSSKSATPVFAAALSPSTRAARS